MVDNTNTTSTVDVTTIYAHSTSNNQATSKERLWCDHCKSHDMSKKFAGKFMENQQIGSQTIPEMTGWLCQYCCTNKEWKACRESEINPFTEQLGAQQKLFSQTSILVQVPQQTGDQHMSMVAHQGTIVSFKSASGRKPRPWIVDWSLRPHDGRCKCSLAIWTTFQCYHCLTSWWFNLSSCWYWIDRIGKGSHSFIHLICLFFYWCKWIFWLISVLHVPNL